MRTPPTGASRGGQRGGRKPISVLDLFSGAGGLSWGLHAASEGFKTVKAVEFDVAAAASFAANQRDVVYVGEIQLWLREQAVPEVDVVVGGPPCQGFSTLGKRDVEDTRNSLWRHYVEAVTRAKPRYFLLENVATFSQSPQLEAFRRRTIGRGGLRDYALEARVLNAADFGAPQARKRTVVIGHHRDLPSPGFPDPTHSRDQWLTVKEALAGLPERVTATELPDRASEFRGQELAGVFESRDLHLTRNYEERSKERFRAIPPGGNRFDLPDSLLSPCWRKHTSGSADVMGRLAWDRPSVTIRTEFFKPEKGRYLHPTEDRALTHHEAARLQGFPDDYQWLGSKASIARQIGNAVPVSLARALATHLSEADGV